MTVPYDPVISTDADAEEVFGTTSALGGRRSKEAAPRDGTRSPASVVHRITLADVKPERVRWLWPGYIPLGKVTVIEGDPDLGKSTLTLALAASVSAALPLPDGTRVNPADVLFVTYEDGVADTIAPRLIAAGGDPEHVHVLDGVTDEGEERLMSFPKDMEALEREIRATGALLVVLDPLGAALAASTDANKDSDVRRALAPLARLAERTGVAIVIVRHLAKGARRNAIIAGSGSIGIGAAARVVLVVHPHPEDPQKRVLSVVKCNVARHAPSLVFYLVDAGNGAARIVWDGISPLSANDLTAVRSDDPGDRGATEEARYWLRELLTKRGEAPKRELLEEGKKEGITQRTLERAKDLAGVKHYRDGFGAPVMWYLPPFSPTKRSLANAATAGASGENGENGALDPWQPSSDRNTRSIVRETINGIRHYSDGSQELTPERLAAEQERRDRGRRAKVPLAVLAALAADQ